MKAAAHIAIATVILAATLAAQAKPNFSGRWVSVGPEKSKGQEQIVKHDDKTLTTEHGSEGGSHRLSYTLDGMEHRTGLPSHGTDITITYTAKWDGPRLIIASLASYSNGMKVRSTEIWSLDAQGRLLVDYTESGNSGPGPSEKMIFVKK